MATPGRVSQCDVPQYDVPHLDHMVKTAHKLLIIHRDALVVCALGRIE